MNLRDWTRVQLDKLIYLFLACVFSLNLAAFLLIQSPLDVAPEPEDQELNKWPKSVEKHDIGYDWCNILEPLRIVIGVDAGLKYFLYWPITILFLNSLKVS